MKRCSSLICAVVPILLAAHSFASDRPRPIDISRGTVRIIKTSVQPDYNLPWTMKDPETSAGTGAIIRGGFILTNAHVVSDATYIQLKKESDPEMYEAEIAGIGHDCDLAILRVKDRRFYRDTIELEFGGIPELRSRVTTYGYPIGGSRISITEGVTSRIEIGEYSHSGSVSFLMIQTDAAINPGNSGGPVIQNNRVVGVAFQASANSDNIGYMIPVPVIEHFLHDVRDGTYNGFPSLGVFTETLDSISYRRYLGMNEGQSGVLVSIVIPGGGAEGHVRPGDVILSLDSVPIANDATIAFMQGRIMYSYLVDRKQIGERVTLSLLRKGKVISATYSLRAHPFRISWFNEYETLPRYCIYGGLVFQPLSKEYLMTWDKWWHQAERRLLYYYSCHMSDNLFPARREFIVLSRVLPDSTNTYLTDIRDRVIDSINGIKILSLADVVEAFKKPSAGFHVINFDGSSYPIVLRASSVAEADARIMEKYNIPSQMRLE